MDVNTFKGLVNITQTLKPNERLVLSNLQVLFNGNKERQLALKNARCSQKMMPDSVKLLKKMFNSKYSIL